jgi:hypothetical protein
MMCSASAACTLLWVCCHGGPRLLALWAWTWGLQLTYVARTCRLYQGLENGLAFCC